MVTPVVAEQVNAIAQRWNVTANAVIERLLEMFHSYLAGEITPSDTPPASEQQTAETTQAAEAALATAMTASEAMLDAKQIVADLLYVIDPIADAIAEICRVYPDLRAECGPYLDLLFKRLNEVAQAYGLMPQPQGEEESETPA